MKTTAASPTSYVILLTERHAAPGKVRVRVVGQDGKPTDSLDRAMRYGDRFEAARAARRVGPAWQSTVVPIGVGPGLPDLPWEAETKDKSSCPASDQEPVPADNGRTSEQ